MLTLPHLQLLIKYHWRAERFAREASAAEKDLMNELDWTQLAELLTDLQLYHQQLLSKDYARQVLHRLLATCADEATAQTFIGYAGTLVPGN
ncbi:hypothetical protein Q5H93_19480 [Hymenobacter sp. ASUV-10]|uniref:Uncharacterized protein n=1 Tax=Hymenobacter aranciens TaxID=3063996 RepID=A0ABT9BFB6_9BACT|nr:hypothetical protein [Hymenobacter sp. ASUV-10]MDO7876937.1 hypothetical protein [Hymenobacter sp. ASUV-10]